ncbi:ATP-binding protein [Spiribacter salinus]|uniref:ATP-binding protein n=1 Tax=Spiribacter salinus TaxID=1335746 RepID=UPI001C95FCCD|nr:ATP-binding protein [Spiribacter salinus]MBY5269207.1 hypothetical protein [Spiribacter salinus]
MADFVDAGTLVLMLSLGTMAFGGVVLVAGNAGDLATRFWSAGFLMGGGGVLLLLLRGQILSVVSIQVGNTIMLGGVACMLCALAVYTQRPRMLRVVALWFLGSVVLFNVAASPPILAPLHARVLIIAGVVSLSQLLAVIILSAVQFQTTRLLNVLRFSHAALGVAFAARFLFILQTHTASDYLGPYPFIGSSIPNGLFFMAAIFIAFVQGPTFMMLKKEQADKEAFEARKQLADEVASRWAERRLQAARLDDARAGTIEHFARGVAHDANNIIGVLQLGYGQIIDQVKRRQKVGAEALKRMETALDQARITTSGLMALSGKEPPPLADVCIETVVDEVASMLESTLPTNIRLELATEPGLLAYTHRGFLISALFNLASNARDAMPRGGVLRLTTQHRDRLPEGAVRIGTPLSGSVVDIAITDQGAGIEPEALGRLFRPMFTTKEHHDGHGYGLYMVQGVVDRTGAALVVETALGQGTTMHFLIREIKRG